MSIGDNIKKYRIKKEMSQEKLSSLVNISSRTLQNYEADKTVPQLDVLIKLSNALEVDFQEIAGNDEKILNDVKTLLEIRKKFQEDMAKSEKENKEKSNVFIPLISYVNSNHCNDKYDLKKLLLRDDQRLYDDICSLVCDIVANRLEHYNNIYDKNNKK